MTDLITEKPNKIDIVATPESWDEILRFTQCANTPADAATAACMAWNFAVDWHRRLDACCEQMRQIPDLNFDDLAAWIAMRDSMSGDKQ